MRFITSTLLILLSVMTSFAQKKSFELKDLIPGGDTYNSFRPKNIDGADFYGDKLIGKEGDSIIVFQNNGEKQKKALITLKQINKALKAVDAKETEKLPTLFFDNNKKSDIAYFRANNTFYFINLNSKKIVESIAFTDNDNSQDINTTWDNVAVCNANRLYVVSNNGERKTVDAENILSSGTEPSKDVIYGQSVHRNEFGIMNGTFWSPSGKLLAFYRMDESMVEDYPLVDVTARQAKLENIKYPMAGMTSHQVRVGVFNPETGKTNYLNTVEDDHYLTNIAWTPDNSKILIAEINRKQDHMDLNMYDAATGELLKTLFSESSDKYVEPEHPAMFINDNQFVWQSQRDGYNHLYLYDIEGNQIRQLTNGKWLVTDLIKADKKGENLFYVSNENGTIDRDLYKLNVKTGKKTRLTKAEGVHNPKLNLSSTYFYDRYSSHSNPGTSQLVNISNRNGAILIQAENPYAEYEMPEITVGTIKAADDTTDLYYRLIKPVDFDPNKKYPVIVYLYNGPHLQLIKNSYLSDTRGWDIYMAQRGHVVFSIDGRGSANRGRDFEQAIHRRLGEEESKDQMKGVEFLQSLPYVDSSRIGIHGWSYGGFMTTNMMLKYPDTFKAGVAGGPVVDWQYYEIMYGERYMGTPESNPEGYENSSLLNRAHNLKGRLLMIHGDIDPVVVLQHSLSFLKKATEVNIYPDYYIYPAHEHNVMGKDRVHLMEKITRYFDDNL